MLELLIRWCVGVIALYGTAALIKGVKVERTGAAFVTVAVIALLNVLVRPLLFILTLPFTILTLGLFVFILNGIVFFLAGQLVTGFEVDDLWSGVLGYIIFSLISAFIGILIIPSTVCISVL